MLHFGILGALSIGKRYANMATRYAYYKGLKFEIEIPKSTNAYLNDILKTVNKMIKTLDKQQMIYCLARLRAEAVVRSINHELDKVNGLVTIADALEDIIYS